MHDIILENPIEIAPAVQAKVTQTIKVVSIIENYGWTYDPSQPGKNYPGSGIPQSVEAIILLDDETNLEKRITVWQDQEYLDVRGTWTDQDLYDKIKLILNPPLPESEINNSSAPLYTGDNTGSPEYEIQELANENENNLEESPPEEETEQNQQLN